MGFCKRESVTLTTDASGDVTGYVGPVHGMIRSIQYVKDDFADGVDFTITGEESGLAVWDEDNVNASKVVAPHHPAHTSAGVGMLFASGGEAVPSPLALAGERLKLVVANGGNAKSGTFHVTWEGA